MDRPDWWEWDLAFTAHVESRMEERGFSEVELRVMLDDATDLLRPRERGAGLCARDLKENRGWWWSSRIRVSGERT